MYSPDELFDLCLGEALQWSVLLVDPVEEGDQAAQ